MKSILSGVLGVVIATFTASASPLLLLETTVTVEDVNGNKDVVTPDPSPVESGKKAIIPFGKYEFTVTPILLADNTLDIHVVVTERTGEKIKQVAVPRLKAGIGQAAEIQVGEISFGMKITPKTSATNGPVPGK